MSILATTVAEIAFIYLYPVERFSEKYYMAKERIIVNG